MSGPTIIRRLETGRRESLRVSIDRVRGVDLVDIRTCVDLTSHCTVQTPTRVGVALKVELLPALIDALQEALASAKSMGLLDG